MKDFLIKAVKLGVLLVGGALAVYGLLCLYRKFFGETEYADFDDAKEFDDDFGYDELAHKEDRIAERINAAK